MINNNLINLLNLHLAQTHSFSLVSPVARSQKLTK